MDLGLQDRVALVAGSSRGIGRAIALALAREGCHVVLAARGEERLEQTAEEARRFGRNALAVAVDLTAPGAASVVCVRARERFGPIDVLVCNTGGSRGEPGSQSTDADWEVVMDLNLRVAVRLCREVIPGMKERKRGVILNTASIFGREWGGPVSYNAAKAALIAYTKSLARELIPFGIRVNSIAPGSILFPGGSWDRRLKADPGKIGRFVETELPRGSFGTPEEIAEVAAFLCSDRASLVAGACLNVDGGQSRSLI
jgi:3-oxoacyl-[acyl-carrier protein] reductase